MTSIATVLSRLNHLVRGIAFERGEGHAWIMRGLPYGDDETHPFQSKLRLLENAVPLLAAHDNHASISRFGGGRYSHWGRTLIFSTSDNSDPNTNGRSYTVDFGLEPDAWNSARISRAAQLWALHPRGDYFLGRGGHDIPPPMTCNIGLTNKCNLRCEICGSQKHLDRWGIRRRNMTYDTFERVAETLFPLLTTVELNSQGDPLLNPNIADAFSRIRDHDCEIKLQTNGTLFSDRNIEMLLQQFGTVMISLDAVGKRFDEVRRGGDWTRAEPGLKKFLAARDPRKLSIGIYPTLTRRTLGDALGVVDWARDHGAELVAFHRYVPIQDSTEEQADDRDLSALRDRLAQWCADNGDAVEVRYETEVLNPRPPAERRTLFASAEKHRLPKEFSAPVVPTEADKYLADPAYICTSPLSYVEIGLEGQVEVCCRAQDVPLGYATSVESFADAWFGLNYRRIRTSLRRAHGGRYALPNCEGCVKFFAPIAGAQRTAVDYDSDEPSDDRLDLGDAETIDVEAIAAEHGLCFTATVPPGVSPYSYALFEDERRLSAHASLHDDIRKLGGGRYALLQRSLYFSTSDGSDPRRNGRHYHLRRLELPADEVRLRWVAPDSGHGFVAALSREVEADRVMLLEDGDSLGPPNCQHADIRSEGHGRYSAGRTTIHFSASDNSDPRANGRVYRVRPVAGA